MTRNRTRLDREALYDHRSRRDRGDVVKAEIKREQEEARRRPLFDDDRIKKAHAAYLRDKAETAKRADKYGIWRV